MSPRRQPRRALDAAECRRSHADLRRQAGAFAVEFAIVIGLFLIMIFTVIEVARAMYIWNTLQVVTRRAANAAAAADFSDSSAAIRIRQNAIFRSSAGMLAFGDPITDEHIQIEYLSLATQADGSMRKVPISNASLPGCPTRNRLICTADSGDSRCVRFVRVRICEPGGDGECTPVQYQPLLPLVQVPIFLPMSTTVVKAGSLGYTPGMPMCQ